MSTAIPFWGDNPLAWDQIKIGGLLMPGRCKVTFKAGERLSVRRSPQTHEDTLVDNGKPSTTGEIEIEFGFESANGSPYGTAREQWARWLEVEAVLWGKKPSKRDAYTVDNAQMALGRITKIYIEDYGSLEGEGPGSRKARFAFRKYGKVVDASSLSGAKAVKAPVKPKTTTSILDLKKPSKTGTAP